jgi:CHAT domain-containing protein
VPFAALRPAREEPPIAAGYTVEVVPSVATWLRWKLAPQGPLPPAALVIADPQARTSVGDGSRDSGSPLPEARREARLAVSRLSGRSRILEGEQATEYAIKSAHLGDYGVLHIAAHARLEDPHRAQASLLLLPGAGGDDGKLTVAEVSSLDLKGRIVALAACRTAGGAFLEGEGVQSLARGFLAAGARSVIGSLWPLRDDETADFFDAFYRRLGAGAPVAEAFTFAQRERIAAGAPAAAWAGLVLVGDGSVPLEPAPRISRAAAIGVLAVLLIAAAALIALLLRLEGRPETSDLDS